MIGPALTIALMIAVAAAPAFAQLRCAAFDDWPPAAPEPRTAPAAVATFDRINRAVKTQPYRVLFLGDSLTERWDLPLWGAKAVWDANMAPRGVLNAGVNGDRTEHLRWRLDHGNLDGPAPQGVVVLIGTNDLGHGRPPAQAAEGIRATLLQLRQKLPDARILLLGLWPRGATAGDRLRQETVQVNRLISGCGDDHAVVYADIGGALLEPNGVLGKRISPDLLHFTAAGYERIVPRLDPLIDRLVSSR
ncbi:MAG TPA: GDSL-type esterase/lipase family protein [Stellaceae bacterium]|nr:GDSL-type esterase/lipase family protein [Stellaceae bacterium]